MMSKEKLSDYLKKVSTELDRCMQFWLSYSHDEKYGGFYNCLSEDGQIYDETKYGWLQGRQVWTYARLYNDFPRFRNEKILQAAIKGGEFLMKQIKDPKTSRCFFSTTRQGLGIKMQRTIFTEVFFVLGLSELYLATGSAEHKKEAVDMMNLIIHWVRVNDSALNKQKFAGVAPVNNLAIPVVMMNLMQQMERMDEKVKKEYTELRQWCLKELLAHVQRNGSCILENVSPDGKELPGCQGRLMIPGHAIEAGWFLLEYANALQRKDLEDTAIDKFIKAPFETAWDSSHGGLFYFLDVDGHCPTQLEWSMKLWWPHNEALVAFLMAYKATRRSECLDKFSQVFEYSWRHFADPKHGEWWGYLSTRGEKSSSFKGGPFKGCFHLPRCLLMCEQMLESLLHTS